MLGWPTGTSTFSRCVLSLLPIMLLNGQHTSSIGLPISLGLKHSSLERSFISGLTTHFPFTNPSCSSRKFLLWAANSSPSLTYHFANRSFWIQSTFPNALTIAIFRSILSRGWVSTASMRISCKKPSVAPMCTNSTFNGSLRPLPVCIIPTLSRYAQNSIFDGSEHSFCR